MDSGETVDPIPDTPLPHASAATFLEVAPVQTQTLAQTDNTADTDAEPGAGGAVPAQRRAAHHPESGPENPVETRAE